MFPIGFLAGAAMLTGCAVAPAGLRPTLDPDGIAVYGRADYGWLVRPLDGEAVELADLRGEVLFVNLWASWCVPCVAEMASIERLRTSLADADVTFLLVSPEEPDPVRRFLQRYRYDLPIYLEIEPIPRAFGLRALPTTFVIDRAGRIVLLHRGAAEWDSAPIRDFLIALASR